jgi:hypothetical protein
MAKLLEVNRGNRFVSLTSTASKARGLEEWADRNLDADHPGREVEWSMGDIVTTTVELAGGETLVVTHDVALPRPYSNMYHVQGTRGVWRRNGDPFRRETAPDGVDERHGRIHLEGESPDHAWEPLDRRLDEHEHPRWADREAAGGHGGIDGLVLRDFVDAVGAGERPPIDVYDAATWMAISPLSEQSIAQGGEPVAVPDFTDGRWLHREPTFGREGRR